MRSTNLSALRALRRPALALATFAWCGLRLVAGTPEAVVPLGSIRVTTNYYIFGGTNFHQMRAAMASGRPWKQTLPFDANTEWHIQSRYNLSQNQNGFGLSGVDVTTTVKITLPRWIPAKPVTWDLVTNWSRCFVGLIVHEQGHKQLALAAGAELRRRLEALSGYPSRQELATTAERTINDTLDEFRRREVKYDEVTGHGRTQGAIFYEVVRVDANPRAPGPATNNFAGPRGGRFR